MFNPIKFSTMTHGIHRINGTEKDFASNLSKEVVTSYFKAKLLMYLKINFADISPCRIDASDIHALTSDSDVSCKEKALVFFLSQSYWCVYFLTITKYNGEEKSSRWIMTFRKCYCCHSSSDRLRPYFVFPNRRSRPSESISSK